MRASNEPKLTDLQRYALRILDKAGTEGMSIQLLAQRVLIHNGNTKQFWPQHLTRWGAQYANKLMKIGLVDRFRYSDHGRAMCRITKDGKDLLNG